MKIAIGSDHAGFALKEALKKHLVKEGHSVEDFGCGSEEPVDYPDVSKKVSQAVAEGKYDFGILLCGTGIGTSITANKVVGIRAALCYDKYTAEMSRAHNDANILTVGGRTTSFSRAAEIVDTFLKTKFEGGRHERRVKKIREIEKNG
ncbi:MAG: ribose 5-phosphate isomerase B [Candidatus Aenigmarchaeota archaeon]|nr:ribose 5-phosphate isomerase B [Candidatus Aenigmarchaeota archaeon]